MLKHNDVISKLTDEQKVRILTSVVSLSGKDMKILGIPNINAAAMKDYGKELYPGATALAHSWDEELWHRVAKEKTEMMLGDGVDLVIAPGSKIKLSPYRREVSEDPYLASVMSAAHLSAAAESGVVAAASGYYLTSSDAKWMDDNPSDRVINEFLVSPYRAAAEGGGAVATVTDIREPSAAYKDSCRYIQDRLDGASEFLICERATDENTVEMISRGIICLEGSANALEGAMTRYKKIKLSIELGDGATAEQMAEEEALYSAISTDTVDAALDRVLELIFRTHGRTVQPSVGSDYGETALRATLSSSVLLKNEENILPLKKESRIAIIGDILFNSGERDNNAVRLHRGLEDRGYRCTGAVRGYDMVSAHDMMKASEAVSLAQNSDLVLLFMGFGYEAEKRVPKTETLSLPANQLYLADELSATGKKVIAVISAGHAPDIAFTRSFYAVLMLPLEVKSSAEALIRLLTGEESPSGRLAYTLYAGSDRAFRKSRHYRKKYGMKAGPFIGYRYYDTAGLRVGYPFGHGLSYTEFKYSGLTVSGNTVSFTVENVGSVKGTEVSQVYMGPVGSSVIRAKKELCGFARTELLPGERKTVSISVRAPEVFTEECFVTEDGEYTVSVGSSVADIRLTGSMQVSGVTLHSDGQRAIDYLQSVSNVKEDNYTLEANYSFMKKSVKNILFGIGFIALAISVAVFNAITENPSLFIGAVSGILAVCAIIFFVMEAVERSRAYTEEREMVNTANEEHFEGAEEIPVFSTEAMFREEFDSEETEVVVNNLSVEEVYDDAHLEYIDEGFRAADAARELKGFFESRGYKLADNIAEGLVSSVATSGLLITGGMSSEDFNTFVKLMAEHFGGEAYLDVAEKKSGTGSAFFNYDYHGDHAKKNLLLALGSARDHAERIVFAALDKAACADLDGYLMPFMRYLHSPRAKNAITVLDENSNSMTYTLAPNLRFIVNLDENESVDMLPSFIAPLGCVYRITLTPCKPSDTVSGMHTLNRYQLEYIRSKESGAEVSEENWKKVDKLEKYAAKLSDYRIGNKLWLGFEKQLGLLISAGLETADALDCAVAARLLPSMAVAVKDKVTEDDQTLVESVEFIFGEDKVSASKELLGSLVFVPKEPEVEAVEEESDNAAVGGSSFSSLFATSPIAEAAAPAVAEEPVAVPAENKTDSTTSGSGSFMNMFK